ncbi:YitT family protein [Psychromonas algicola]|uniref:YitT family protein n=1 Tax=Psychromonas algicola TaxID=2555642 RepID=UPI001067650C|nr:YitT family protein [Psychromonas sp. RZ5]TEW51231.1 YitT family protein [Psychromonas sp. RZ5]
MALAKTLINHRWFEDAMALLIGTSLVSFGVVFLKLAGLLTGGTAGLSLFVHYKTELEFGLIFFLINLPFYYFAIRRMGWVFTAKTFTAVFLVSAFSSLHERFIDIQALNPIYAAVFGAFLFGVGFIILFRHKASLGGFNILALYLQDKFAIKAGWLLMGADLTVMLISLSVVSPYQLVLSICCGVVLNLIIALNHRNDRYTV